MSRLTMGEHSLSRLTMDGPILLQDCMYRYTLLSSALPAEQSRQERPFPAVTPICCCSLSLHMMQVISSCCSKLPGCLQGVRRTSDWAGCNTPLWLQEQQPLPLIRPIALLPKAVAEDISTACAWCGKRQALTTWHSRNSNGSVTTAECHHCSWNQ